MDILEEEYFISLVIYLLQTRTVATFIIPLGKVPSTNVISALLIFNKSNLKITFVDMAA